MHVTEALSKSDQTAATHEKFLLEDAQRKATKERKAKMENWVPGLFERDPITGDWLYKYLEWVWFLLCSILNLGKCWRMWQLIHHLSLVNSLRPWDPLNDLLQYEHDFIVQTKTRHRTPIVRTTSITNVDDQNTRSLNRQSSIRAVRIKRNMKQMRSVERESGSSTPDVELRNQSESSDSGGEGKGHREKQKPVFWSKILVIWFNALSLVVAGDGASSHKSSSRVSLRDLELSLEPLHRLQTEKCKQDHSNAQPALCHVTTSAGERGSVHFPGLAHRCCIASRPDHLALAFQVAALHCAGD